MGLWDKIAGTGGKTSSTTNSTQTNTGTQAQTGSTSTSGKTTTLDPGTISLLQGVIQTLGGNVGNTQDADAIRGLSGDLAGLYDPAAVEQNVSLSLDAAKQNFDNTVGADLNVMSNVIGSKGNSFAQLISGQANAGLAVQLGKLASDIRLQGSAQQSANIQGAIGGYGAAASAENAPLQGLLAAIATLTGAETETDNTQLYDLMNTMNSTTDFQGTEVSKSKNTPGLVPTVVSLFG